MGGLTWPVFYAQQPEMYLVSETPYFFHSNVTEFKPSGHINN